jgi:hypothetical protein
VETERETHKRGFGASCKCSTFCPILTKIKINPQVLAKLPKNKCHKNPFSERKDFSWGQREGEKYKVMRKPIISLRNCRMHILLNPKFQRIIPFKI